MYQVRFRRHPGEKHFILQTTDLKKIKYRLDYCLIALQKVRNDLNP